MSPNLYGSTDTMYSAEPIQIISQPKGQDYQLSSLKNQSQLKQQREDGKLHYKWHIVWRNVLAFIYLHTFGLYGMYLVFTTAMWKTFFWVILLLIVGGQGVTAGAHRLWAHRTYKATLGLRIFLMLAQTLAFQNHLYEWVRDHRVHHKFTDTDADPHNASRGFFFSHIGWLMVKKHKDVFAKGATVDLSDLLEDPVVRFQKKFYLILVPLMSFVLPTLIPWYYWNENIYVAFYTAAIFRYTLSLNFTWLVNSAAHIWGNKPYDKTIKPVESKSVAIVAMGEGWHNYHHVFPWDYKAAELGNYRMNLTTGFIDLMQKWGFAYDLKTASNDMILKRIKRTGDGTWRNGQIDQQDEPGHDHHDHDLYGDQVWGWGDQDMKDEDIKAVKVHNKLKDN